MRDRKPARKGTLNFVSGAGAGPAPSLTETGSASGRNGSFWASTESAFVGFEGSERAQPWLRLRARQNIPKAARDRRARGSVVIASMVARLSGLQQWQMKYQIRAHGIRYIRRRSGFIHVEVA